MKKLIILLLSIPTFVFSQGWEKTYEYGIGKSVQQTSDDGYIITGYTETNSNTSDVFLIRTDSYGDTLWVQVYSEPNDDKGNSVQQTIDGGYIITGWTNSYSNNYDIFLIKTNSNGNPSWTKTYGGNYGDVGTSVQQTLDGGYIVTGTTHSSSYDTDIYLIKTDSNGDTLWTKTYGESDNDEGYSVQQSNDEGYIITGQTTSIDGDKDLFLIKTDEVGETIWDRTYGGYGDDIGYSVQQTTDGGYIVTGLLNNYDTGYSDVYLLKTDNNGDTLWTKTYDRNWDDVGYSVQQTTDGGYIITGSVQYVSHYSDIYLIKTNSSGDTLWTKTYGDGSYNFGYSVQQTTDGGYIITGYSLESNNSYYVNLIKTDENGIITSTTEIHIPNPNRKLINLIDLSGREITIPKKNRPFIEVYDDGTTQKKMILK